MDLVFDKYHGCGNDFVIINNLDLHCGVSLPSDVVNHICNRRYGVGADGLILLNPSDVADYRMVYYNADGNESTMCGNGGRCIVAFAKAEGIIKDHCRFEAIDGIHHGEVLSNGHVKIDMIDVEGISRQGDGYMLDTGSPHYVTLVNGIETFEVYSEGKSIRNSEAFVQEGINVNFVEKINGDYRIRTYERGVEAETDACGTGVTAAAIVLSKYYDAGSIVTLLTNGGELQVEIGENEHQSFKEIYLIGPAVKVYSGRIEI